MWNDLSERLLAVLKSRLLILLLLFVGLFLILLQRIFSLQIIHGDEYLNDFTLKIKREKSIAGTRGTIFDRNGNVLAYNELAYRIQIEDNGSYDTKEQKNKELNEDLYELVHILEKKGESLVNDFGIQLDENGSLAYNVTDKALKRFLAEVYGTSVAKLKDKQLNSTAEQAFQYLCSNKRYGISSDYSTEDALKILRIRFAMSENNFQKYITTTVADNVKEETVAVIMENSDTLQGVSVEEVTARKYVDSEYFAQIIGYTGKVSTEELQELKKENKEYESNDVVGKAGMEQYMETTLQGKKGYETLYVDNVGKVVETADKKDAQVGNDVYLSIDMNLQKAVYNILEQKLAGILVSKIKNIRSYTPTANSKADDIVIPIDNVYFSLINNNIINLKHMSQSDASDTEKETYQVMLQKRDNVVSQVLNELSSTEPAAYQNLSDEMQDYMKYVLSILMNDEILKRNAIDTSNNVYKNWKNEKISLKEFLMEAIAQNWLDISKISEEGRYTNSDETFQAIVQYMHGRLENDNEFNKKLFQYMIRDNQISGRQICILLYDQGVLAYDEGTVQGLKNGTVGSYDFMLNKINTLEITPAQLALDPCSGSCVITDVTTGEVLAMVSYPGYDNNRLANSVDAEYYNTLLNDLSKPLYNRATQEKNAPGSTFKMVTSVAGLSEGVISTGETIRDEVVFKKITPSPKCWSSSGHGSVNVSQAIEHSCNYFFYEVGYRLSMNNGQYNADTGLTKLRKYAELFGLNEKSGVEITESKPEISDEYPVPSSIGQGTNNFTSVQLARYVTAVANSGTSYKLSLLDKVTDSSGNIIKDYTPEVYSKIDISSSIWNAVHQGMRAVAQRTACLKKLSIPVAGKTGTAQENKLRPNHALFVGYAPYDDPKIAMCVKIANGYTSANSAEVGSDVVKYYFNLVDSGQLLNGMASTPSTATIVD